MGVKGRLVEFLVEYDLIPARVRWRKSASGVGRLFNDIFTILDEDGRKSLTKLMYEWGLHDADRLTKTLEINKDLHSATIALMAMHRVFGIKSHVAKEDSSEIVIHATQCLWKDKNGWTPKTCGAISTYEAGVIEGINPSIEHIYTKRRSQGDSVCELILRTAKVAQP